MRVRARVVVGLLLVMAGLLLSALAKVTTVEYIGIAVFVLGVVVLITLLPIPNHSG
jgi:hypothetical protein